MYVCKHVRDHHLLMHHLRMLQMSTSCISLKDMNGDRPLFWTQTVCEGHFMFCQRRTCWNNICTKSEVYQPAGSLTAMLHFTFDFFFFLMKRCGSYSRVLIAAINDRLLDCVWAKYKSCYIVGQEVGSLVKHWRCDSGEKCS